MGEPIYDAEEASWRDDPITREQASCLLDLIRQAREHDVAAAQDQDTLLELTRGEADELIEELEARLEKVR